MVLMAPRSDVSMLQRWYRLFVKGTEAYAKYVGQEHKDSSLDVAGAKSVYVCANQPLFSNSRLVELRPPSENATSCMLDGARATRFPVMIHHFPMANWRLF